MNYGNRTQTVSKESVQEAGVACNLPRSLKLLIPNATDLVEIEIIASPVNLCTFLPLHHDPIGNFFSTINITKISDVYITKNKYDIAMNTWTMPYLRSVLKPITQNG
jgi:hypothetical protein